MNVYKKLPVFSILAPSYGGHDNIIHLKTNNIIRTEHYSIKLSIIVYYKLIIHSIYYDWIY